MMLTEEIIDAARQELVDNGLLDKDSPLPETFTRAMVFCLLEAARMAVEIASAERPTEGRCINKNPHGKMH